MAKKKSPQSQKKKNENHEKESKNVETKAQPKKTQQPAKSKGSQKQASTKSKPTAKSSSSCLTFWLVMTVLGAGIAVTGVVFQSEIETLEGYQVYVKPHVMTAQELLHKTVDDVVAYTQQMFPNDENNNERVKREENEQDRLQNQKEEEEKRARLEEERQQAEKDRLEKEKREEEDRIRKQKAEEQAKLEKEKEERFRKQKEEDEERIRKQKEKEENDRKRKEEERLRKQKEEEDRIRKQKEEEERIRKQKEEEERIRKQKEEEERIRKQKEEEERIRKQKEEEERQRKQKEEEERQRKQKEEEERIKKQKEEEERIRKLKEEKEKIKKQKEEEERIRKQKEEEERIKKQKEEEERIRKQKEEEERIRQQKAEEERIRKQKEEEERIRQQKEREEHEKARLRKEKEEQKRKQREEEQLRSQKEEENKARLKKQQEDQERKRQEEETLRKQKQEEQQAKLLKEKLQKEEEEKARLQKQNEEQLKKQREEEERIKREKEEQEKQAREERERLRKEEEEKARAQREIKQKEEEVKKRKQQEAEEQAKLKKAKEEEEHMQKEKQTKGEADKINYVNAVITSEKDFEFRAVLDEADHLREKEKFEEALRKYDSVLTTNVESPRALYGKGLTLDKLGFKEMSNEHLENAINILKRAFALQGVPDELMKMIGRKLADRQQFRGWGGESVKTSKALSQKFPEDMALKKELGVSYMMIGQNDRAKDVFRQVLATNPDDSFAKVHFGFILKVQGSDLKEAVRYLKEGIDSGEEGTQDGRFYLHLGDSLIRLEKEQEARSVYKAGADKGLFISEWQRSLYNVDGLTSRPFWTPEQTGYQSFFKTLQDNWKTIKEEGLSQLNTKQGLFVPEDENLRDTGDWKQLTLWSQGRMNKANCEKTPKTCELISKFPDAKSCTRGQVKFSVMSPGIHVWPHTGPTNCRIRAHLGLVVPEGPLIRVTTETRKWKEGEFLIFDDSFEHEVWHEGSEMRLVLIVDVWHPEITAQQKRRLSPI